jgi:hypothetical protein
MICRSVLKDQIPSILPGLYSILVGLYRVRVKRRCDFDVVLQTYWQRICLIVPRQICTNVALAISAAHVYMD